MAGSNLDAASGIKDPILRIAAQHVLEQHARDQADPLAQYKIPDEEWAAVAEPRTESQPWEAVKAGAFSAGTLPARALFKVGGENSIDSLLERNFPKEHAGIQRRLDFKPDTPAEELGYGAGKLGVEAATLFAPAGGIADEILKLAAGKLAKRGLLKAATMYAGKQGIEKLGPTTAARLVGTSALETLSRNIPGNLVVKAASGAGTFGIADAARYALEREAAGQSPDISGTLAAGGRGAIAGAALGPAGVLPNAALRIPAEAVTMGVVSAAQEGRAPTEADIGANLVLFTLMHGIAKVPTKLQGYAAQVEILKDAFQKGRQNAQMAGALTSAINDMDPSVVSAFGRAVAHPDTPDVRAQAFGEIDPKLRKALEDARAALNVARGRDDSEGELRAQNDVDVILKRIDQANSSIVKDWNDAVDAARAARGGGPPALAEEPTTPGKVENYDPAARRQQLEQEAAQLEQEVQVGGTAPDQQAAATSRLQAIRGELEAMPTAPPVPTEQAMAESTIDPTFAAIEDANARRVAEPPGPPGNDLRPNQMRRQLERRGIPTSGLSPSEMAAYRGGTEPVPRAPLGSRGVSPTGRQATPVTRRPGGLTYSDMPDTVARDARPELKRVLSEAGIRGKRRKALMQGPDLWKRAAWEYYKRTGKIPEAGIQGKVRAAESAGFPEPPAGSRWTGDRGAMPGEPMQFLDFDEDTGTARAAVIEHDQPERGTKTYQAVTEDEGAIAPERETLAQAAQDAEKQFPKEEPQAPAEPEPAPPAPLTSEGGKPTPQFREGDVVISRGATLVVKKVIIAPVFDPVDRVLKTEVMYDLANGKGEVSQLGVHEGGVMPTDYKPADVERTPSQPAEKPIAPGAKTSVTKNPTVEEILSGRHNTIATQADYEKARATLRGLAKGLKINAGINPEALAALFKIGEYHLERLIRAGAAAGKDLYDRWSAAIRLELEDAEATISDERLRWMWDNPDIKSAVATVEKEVANVPGRVPGAGKAEGQPEPGGGRTPTQEPAKGPKGAGIPGGPRAGDEVRGPREKPGEHPGPRRPGGPPAEGVSGDRKDEVLRTDVRLDRGKPVELTPAKRKAANAAAEKIITEKTAAETTDADREILRQYTGHGGLEGTEGRGFLWQHYTSYPVVDFIWKKLKAMGWKGKDVLEPAAGVGNFIGFKPEGVNVDAVELDPTAAEIARRLYPQQKVTTGPFETFKGKAGGYDLVIGNPPFNERRGRMKYAPEAADYRDVDTLHDFFVVKAIDQLKPGGVLAYVISTGVMDKPDPGVRSRIGGMADLVAAYRLPSKIFEKNADYAGSVDVLFFQKRGGGTLLDALKTLKDWGISQKEEKYGGAPINTYWAKHPERVLGDIEPGYGQQWMTQIGVRGEFTPEVEQRVLEDKVRLRPPPTVDAKPPEPKPETKAKPKGEAIEVPANVRLGEHFVDKTRNLYVATAEGGLPYDGPSEPKVRAAVEISGTVDKIREAMRSGDTSRVDIAQKILRKQLDNWSALARSTWPDAKTKAWFRQDKTLNRVMREDPNLYTLRALVNDDGTYADIVTKPTIYSTEYGKKRQDFKDFNVAALEVQRRLGQVDEANFRSVYKGPSIEFDREMRKRPEWNRTGSGWVHDSDYLYGDVRKKLDEAKALGIQSQVEKLREALPPQATSATWIQDLSAGWLDPETVARFGKSVFGVNYYKVRDRYETKDWARNGMADSITVGGKHFDRPKVSVPWTDLIQDRLNGKHYKPVPPKFDSDGHMTSEGMSEKEAVALNSALEAMDPVFDAWARESGEKDQLVDSYNARFKSWRQKEYEPTVQVDGFSSSYFKRIHPWQAKIVNWLMDVGRGINSLGTGGGKTLSFILLAQKLKQEGMVQKPLFVVPGKVINKWVREYLAAFPDAKVLNLTSLTGESNSPRRRYELLQRAALNNWDAIVMSYEGNKEIPMSEAATTAWFQKQIENLRRELANAPANDKKSRRNVEEAILSLEEKLAKALDFDRTKTIDFENLGVDALFVDEAHAFKNLPTASTGLASELNLGGKDAQRAIDMALKTEYILNRNGNRNVFFASATPTPNSPIEIYTMTSFLAPDVWEEKGIRSLHGFLSTFADVALKPTSDIGGGHTTKNVIVGFKNFQDLKQIRERFIYMRSSKQMREEYPTYEYREPEAKTQTRMLDPSPKQEEAIGRILTELRKGPPLGVNPWNWKSAMLMKARKAAISPGLYSPREWENYEHPNNKLDAIADDTAAAYHENKRNPPPLPDDADPNQPALNGHAIFLDLYGKSGEPPMARNLYLRLTDALVKRGVPAEEIARVSGSENAKPKDKARVADDFNSGKIRVVIGNTLSMGEGMDLQKIGTNLSHWDTPWNPDGMKQREGRMVRQGNPATEVIITRYVTRGTTDQFMYGKLAQKQKWGDNLFERDQDYVKNEFSDDPGEMSLEDLERALDAGEHTRRVFEAKDELSLAEAGLKLQQAQTIENKEKLKKVEDEIAERTQKVQGYLGKQKQAGEPGAFQHFIDQHEEALVTLRKAKGDLEKILGGFVLTENMSGRVQMARATLKKAESIRDRVTAGDTYATAVAKQELDDEGIAFPEGLSVEKLAAGIQKTIEALDDGKKVTKDMLSEMKTRLEQGRSSVRAYLMETGVDNDVFRSTWRTLFGELPKIPPRGGTPPRSLGSASGPEMSRAERRHRQYLVSEAKRLGIGLPIPTPEEAKARSDARIAAASGKPIKPKSRMEATAIPVPEEGRAIDDVERRILEEDGEVNEDRARKLGQPHITQADWDGLSRGEKLVHLSRYIRSTTNAKHLENILGSRKYQVWGLPKADQEALAAVVGERMTGAGLEDVPAALRSHVTRMERAAEAESDSVMTRTRKWVFSLFPAEHNLKNLGIVEGATGMRQAYLVIGHESQLWDQHASTHLFRDDRGRLMKEGGRDDEIIYKLSDNPGGDPEGIDRASITLDSGEVVSPEPWHRARSREWQDIYGQFADRQDLPIEKRQQFYMRHLIDRRLAFEDATPKDILNIHSYARKALEGNYDAAKLNAALGKGLKRNKALQILDALNRKSPPATMKGLARKIDTILGADEHTGVPKELWIPHLLKRRGGTPYKQSAILAFKAYVPYAMRKIHLEPAVLAAKPIVESLAGKDLSATLAGVGVQTQRVYAEKYLDSVLGRPTRSDLASDAMLSSLNDLTHGKLLNVPILWRLFKPALVSRASRSLSQIQYVRLLGFAVDSALTNISQGVNTLAEFGLKDTFVGYLNLANPRFWKQLHQEKLLGEFRQIFSGPVAPWEHPLNVIERVALAPFSVAEFINRGAAFAAGLQDARGKGLSFERAQQVGMGRVSDYLMQHPVKKAGITDRLFGAPQAAGVFSTSPALTHARAGVLKTQFGYSAAESSPVMRTPVARIAYQFWNYPTRQAAFLFGGAADAMRSGQNMQFARFLALLGATVTAPLWGPAVGEDLRGFWSVWSLFPRDFGPNSKIAYYLFKSIPPFEDKDAQRQLKRQMFLKGYGFRFIDKVMRQGESAALPFRPIEEPAVGGGRRPGARAGGRPSYARPGGR